jgi:hypothetical protein
VRRREFRTEQSTANDIEAVNIEDLDSESAATAFTGSAALTKTQSLLLPEGLDWDKDPSQAEGNSEQDMYMPPEDLSLSSVNNVEGVGLGLGNIN